MHSHKLSLENAKAFIFGGNATITLLNTITGERRTYRVKKPKRNRDESNPIFWVSLMTGSDNESHYTHLGTLYDKTRYVHKRTCRIEESNASVQGFLYLLAAIHQGKIAPAAEIWHEGKCCRCGRKLTVPESIETGIGPECAKLLSALRVR